MANGFDWDNMPQEIREAALESFEESLAKWNNFFEHSKRQVDDAEENYRRLKAKHDEIVTERDKFQSLVEMLRGLIPDTDDEDDEDDEVSREVIKAPPFSLKGAVILPKRITYPSSPKAKLKEIIESTRHCLTDEGLKQRLEIAFQIPNIPMKTVQNKLLELESEGVIKRIKRPDTREFVSGLPDWFEPDGSVREGYLVLDYIALI